MKCVTSALAVLSLALATLGVSSAASAFGSDYQIGFGPHVGGGTVSNEAKVRHTSGYSLSVERNWQLGESLFIGPRFEVTNSFVNMRAEQAGTTNISTYDNRIVAAGFRVGQAVGNDHTFAQGAYLSAVYGRGYSKLAVDETTERTYLQSLYGNISGDYFGGELGGWVPLKGNFGLNIAVVGSLYRANQAAATGTYQGDQVDDNGQLQLTQGEYSTGELDSRIVMRTLAAKFGLSLGF